MPSTFTLTGLRARRAAILLLGGVVFLMLLAPVQRYWPYRLIHSFRVDDPGLAATTPDGTTYVVATQRLDSVQDASGALQRKFVNRGPIRVFDLATGLERGHVLSHEDRLSWLSVSPNSQWVVAEDCAGKLLLYDLRSAERRMELRTSVDPLGAGVSLCNYAFSPDSRFLASEASDEKSIQLHDMVQRKLVAMLPNACRPMTFAGDGRLLATAGPDLAIRIWHISTGQLIVELTGHSIAPKQIVFSNDVTRLLTGLPIHENLGGVKSKNEILYWDLRAKALVATLESGHVGTGYFSRLAFNANDTLAFLLSPARGHSAAWDLTGSPPQVATEVIPLPSTTSPPGALGTRSLLAPSFVTPDGRILARASEHDQTIVLYDTVARQTRHVLELARDDQDANASWFSSDGKHLSVYVLYKGFNEQRVFSDVDAPFHRSSYEPTINQMLKVVDVISGEEIARFRKLDGYACEELSRGRLYTANRTIEPRAADDYESHEVFYCWDLPPRPATGLHLSFAGIPALLLTALLWWRLGR